MKVMLVEDAKGMRKLMVSMIKSMGMGMDEVIEAVDGNDALERLRTRRVDLLLTDWNMPIMDGIELVEKLRSTPEYDSLPILMFTARSAKEDVLRALKAGVDTYIAKPFTPQQLKAKIQSILGKRSQNQVAHILNNQIRLGQGANHPLVIFGEAATSPQQLNSPSNREILNFLKRAVGSLTLINAGAGDLKISYRLEGSTVDVTKRLRAFRERVRMLLISIDLPGGGVTLARLASINRQSALSVFVICESRNEIPTKARFGLEHLGIKIFERHQMDAESIEQLFNEYIIAPVRDGIAIELPSPEEIRQRLESDIRSMVSLPVLPQVYHQIVALDRDQDSDIQDWIKAIEVDPLSRAQVIRRARSPLYGFRGEIDETSKAVILLGKNAVKEIIVSGAVKRSFEGVREEGFNVDDYWLHSVGVALAARLLTFPLDENAWTPEQRQDFETFALDGETIAALKKLNIVERLKVKPHQDPLIGGMMHDIGKVALVHGYPGLFPMIVQDLEIKSWNAPMRLSEEMVAGGADHALVGRILAQSWKLGDDLTRVIENHHRPGAEDRFAQLIALANFLGGGIYPYPKQAAFPMVRLLGEAPPAETAAANADKPRAQEEPSADPAGPTSPEEAALLFLPEGLLERLEIPLGELIALGRRLAPSVRRLAEDLRKTC